jgi:hypothetical protein
MAGCSQLLASKNNSATFAAADFTATKIERVMMEKDVLAYVDLKEANL